MEPCRHHSEIFDAFEAHSTFARPSRAEALRLLQSHDWDRKTRLWGPRIGVLIGYQVRGVQGSDGTVEVVVYSVLLSSNGIVVLYNSARDYRDTSLPMALAVHAKVVAEREGCGSPVFDPARTHYLIPYVLPRDLDGLL